MNLAVDTVVGPRDFQPGAEASSFVAESAPAHHPNDCVIALPVEGSYRPRPTRREGGHEAPVG